MNAHRTQFDLVEEFWRAMVAVDDRILARARRDQAHARLRRAPMRGLFALLAAAVIALVASEMLHG